MNITRGLRQFGGDLKEVKRGEFNGEGTRNTKMETYTE